MNNQKIENVILSLIFIRGLFLIFFSKLSIIDLIIGSVIAFILIVIYQKLNIKKNSIWQVISLFLFIMISIYLLNDISFFIKDNLLKQVSLIIIALTLILLSLQLTFKGYHTYIKTIELSAYVLIFMGILSLILLVPYIDFRNINRLVEIVFSFASLKLAFTIFLVYMALNYLSNYQINYKTYGIAIINTILIKLLMVLTLSQTLINVFKYPYVSMFKRISFFNFLERLENFLAIQYLFDFLFLLTLFMMSIKYLLIKLFKIKKDSTTNVLLSISSLTILILSLILQ